MTRVAFPFVGDTIGGSHVSAALLMRALPAFGFEPTALLHRDGPLAEFFAARDITVERSALPFVGADAAGARALVRIVTIAPQLAGHLRAGGYALVHANDGRMIASWMVAGRLAGIGTIAHRRTRWTPSRLALLSMRAAHRIIAISDYVHDNLPHVLAQRTSIIHNPFELTPEPSTRHSPAVPTIGFIGTLQHQKRPDVFVAAARRLVADGLDARFVMIGRDGDRSDELREAVRIADLEDRIALTGFRSDIPEQLATLDLLLAPAVGEGHGRTVMEAMLAGVPVVAAASGGHLEIIRHGETGMLVPPDDADSLADAARLLLAASDWRRKMSLAAWGEARAAADPTHHAALVAKLYRELIPSA